MATKEDLRARLSEIDAEMKELHEARREMAMFMATSVGTDEDGAGIHIDPLTMWARRIKPVNTKLKNLADERRALRAERRALNPCECNCH